MRFIAVIRRATTITCCPGDSVVCQPATMSPREATVSKPNEPIAEDQRSPFDPSSVERWRHEVLQRGFLFPIGTGAVLARLTEIGVHDGGNGEFRTTYEQRRFILVGGPGRTFPMSQPLIISSLLTIQTPDILDPAADEFPPGYDCTIPGPNGRLATACGLVFWPRVSGGPGGSVPFDAVVAGRMVKLPLLFLDSSAAEAPGLVAWSSATSRGYPTMPNLVWQGDRWLLRCSEPAVLGRPEMESPCSVMAAGRRRRLGTWARSVLSRPPPALVNSGSTRGPSDCPGSRTRWRTGRRTQKRARSPQPRPGSRSPPASPRAARLAGERYTTPSA